jgi:hypothetical protein
VEVVVVTLVVELVVVVPTVLLPVEEVVEPPEVVLVSVGVVQLIQSLSVYERPWNWLLVETMFDVLTLWPRRNLLKKAFRVGVSEDGQAQCECPPTWAKPWLSGTPRAV